MRGGDGVVLRLQDLHNFGVIAEPAVRVHDVAAPKDQFLVLASDGVWDHANEFDIVELVREAQRRSLEQQQRGGGAGGGGGGGGAVALSQKHKGGGRKHTQQTGPRSRGHVAGDESKTTNNGSNNKAGRGDTLHPPTMRWNAPDAAQRLCDLARSRWVERQGRVDDVTAIVVNLAAVLKWSEESSLNASV